MVASLLGSHDVGVLVKPPAAIKPSGYEMKDDQGTCYYSHVISKHVEVEQKTPVSDDIDDVAFENKGFCHEHLQRILN